MLLCLCFNIRFGLKNVNLVACFELFAFIRKLIIYYRFLTIISLILWYYFLYPKLHLTMKRKWHSTFRVNISSCIFQYILIFVSKRYIYSSNLRGSVNVSMLSKYKQNNINMNILIILYIHVCTHRNVDI